MAKTITHPAARSLCDSWASCFSFCADRQTHKHEDLKKLPAFLSIADAQVIRHSEHFLPHNYSLLSNAAQLWWCEWCTGNSRQALCCQIPKTRQLGLVMCRVVPVWQLINVFPWHHHVPYNSIPALRRYQRLQLFCANFLKTPHETACCNFRLPQRTSKTYAHLNKTWQTNFDINHNFHYNIRTMQISDVKFEVLWDAFSFQSLKSRPRISEVTTQDVENTIGTSRHTTRTSQNHFTSHFAGKSGLTRWQT